MALKGIIVFSHAFVLTAHVKQVTLINKRYLADAICKGPVRDYPVAALVQAALGEHAE